MGRCSINTCYFPELDMISRYCFKCYFLLFLSINPGGMQVILPSFHRWRRTTEDNPTFRIQIPQAPASFRHCLLYTLGPLSIHLSSRRGDGEGMDPQQHWAAHLKAELNSFQTKTSHLEWWVGVSMQTRALACCSMNWALSQLKSLWLGLGTQLASWKHRADFRKERSSASPSICCPPSAKQEVLLRSIFNHLP